VEKSIVGRTHLMSWEGNWEVRFYPNNQGILGGSFKYFFNVHPYLGKIPNLTSIFCQMGWFNHQLIYRIGKHQTWFLDHLGKFVHSQGKATMLIPCIPRCSWVVCWETHGEGMAWGRTWQDESLGEIDL